MPQEASFTVLFTSHLNIHMPSAQFSSNDCTIPIPCDTSQRCRILPSGMFDAFSTTTWTCQTQCTHCWWFTSVSNPMILLRLRNAGSHPKSKNVWYPPSHLFRIFRNLQKPSQDPSQTSKILQNVSNIQVLLHLAIHATWRQKKWLIQVIANCSLRKATSIRQSLFESWFPGIGRT